ncbi:hypothetical protein DMA12_46640 [Amycolatopsis balhimycina DSM 5908]|uniref:Uncharacterized protein n=1 Tax=Amycolatopsis balhimycina DSM 5908 TaxID=1081091 RepID=A0A428VVI1_AMYBA|nr:hypothetical protein [Amycolatopsis balhimycina]RSM34836.1 hypothetical protein DMA12_46640 [Amycolatopsis balhimycina DSM 5908]
MPSDMPLTRRSFPDLRPIAVPQSIAVLPDRRWTADEWGQIRMGYRSPDMDHRWDVLVEGDVVFMHRSWTGYGIYEVTFTLTTGGGRTVGSALVETDPQRHRRQSDDHDRLTIELIITSIMLGEPAKDLWTALRDLTTRS